MPTLNPKKIVIIMSALFVVVAAIIIAVKFLYPAVPAPTAVVGTPPTDQGGGVLPQAGQSGELVPVGQGGQQLEPNTGEPVAGEVSAPEAVIERDNKIQDLIEYTSSYPTLAGDGSAVQYYDRADNKFYRLNEAGEPEVLSQKEFFNVQSVVWSPDKNQAILAYPDNTKIIYNFHTDQQVSLPSHWEDFAFAPAGNQLVFKSIGYDPADSWLGVVDDNGAGARSLEKIGTNADKVIPSWSPNNQTVAMYAEGQSFDQTSVYFVGLNGENFKSMIVNGRGFKPLWSPTGSRLLYSVYSSNSQMKPLLWTAEAQGETIGANLTPINLQTWADKCVFSSDTEAYCAVPTSLPTGAGLSPLSALNATDNLYLVNLVNGSSTLINSDNRYNMSNLILTKDGQALYFTDKITGKLYKLSL